MKLRGIDHVGVVGKDTEALKDWYVKMFDLRVVYDNGRAPNPTYFLKFPDGNMMEIYASEETSTPTGNKTQGIRHLAIIPYDFDIAVKELTEEGVEVVTPPTSKNGTSTFFFRDIEGNIVHLISRSKGMD